MHILFTGGSGFIGRHFIQRYPRYRYTVLSRSPQRAARVLPDSVAYLQQLDELDNLDDFDAVINLCGEPIADKRWTRRQKDVICQSRWQPTRKLVQLFQCSTDAPEVFISGSAVGFYGDTGAHRTTEHDPPASKDFSYNLCDRWEQLARGAESCTRLVLLRTGVVLGQGGGALAKMALPFRFGLGGKVGSGRQYLPWIHMEDMVAAMDYLLRSGSARGVFNMTAPESLPNDSFSHTLADVMNTRARLPVPECMLRAMMGEAADLLLNSQRIYPQKLIDLGYEFRFPELQPALVDLMGANAKSAQ